MSEDKTAGRGGKTFGICRRRRSELKNIHLGTYGYDGGGISASNSKRIYGKRYSSENLARQNVDVLGGLLRTTKHTIFLCGTTVYVHEPTYSLKDA